MKCEARRRDAIESDVVEEMVTMKLGEASV
jgi:hypothetical protein